MQETHNDNEGKFNFGLATLERIHRTLQDIKAVMVEGTINNVQGIDAAKAQHIQITLLWSLYFDVCVLTDDKNDNALLSMLQKIQPRGQYSSNGLVPAYSDDVNTEIRLFVVQAMNALQSNGQYIMPKKKERMF